MKKFTIIVKTWWDKVNGNTYHSCRVIRHCDGEEILCPMQYGYGDAYQQTAITAMARQGFIPTRYEKQPYMYERENGYPIIWAVSGGTKKETIDNGEES